jgi:outer membrane protein OmpA-like peptidoglycan-associated protein
MKAIYLVPVLALMNVPLSAAPPCDKPAADAKAKQAEEASTASSRADLARQAIALCDSSAAAHNTLGTALEESGDLKGAAAEYQRAAELDPKWYLPVMGLGDVAKAGGDTKAAEGHYVRAMSLAGNDKEREAANQALGEVRKAGSGFSFKDAGSIASGLKLGEEATRTASRGFGVAEPVGQDFYESSAGLAMNLSIIFNINSSDLTPEGMKQLDEVGKAVASAPEKIRFRIEGSSSSEGTKEVNIALSKSRAMSVRDYLVKRYKVAPSRLDAVGKGSAVPVTENGVENREKSRRVTMIRLYDH